jgi:hypothetical protein
MSKAKLGFLVAALACFAGTTTVARASDVQGSVVCAGTGAPIGGVAVALAYGGAVFTGSTNPDGIFNVHVFPIEVSYSLSFDGAPPVGTFWIGLGLNPTPWLLDGDPALAGVQPFEVDAPGCAPPPTCEPVFPPYWDVPYCPDRPIGNPRAECGLFGLTVLDKDEGAVSSASVAADLALVKAGPCYAAYLGVAAGDPLSSPTGSAVSHVTYCVCD